jgi:acyl-CoA reductase-like NAD-dependent aldehyde dehydrogenase
LDPVTWPDAPPPIARRPATRSRRPTAHCRAWRGKTAKERAQILRRMYDLMMANQEDLATMMTAEQGKPMTESRGEIAYAAAFIEWFGEEGKRVYGDTIPAHAATSRPTQDTR